MKYRTKSVVAFLLLVAFAEVSALTPAVARGGAANIMGSPGYQRALEESRKRYRESYSQPYVHSPAAHPRKTYRHRGRHH